MFFWSLADRNAPFPPLKGGKPSSIFYWPFRRLLCDRNARFQPLKEGGNARQFFFGLFGPLFRFQVHLSGVKLEEMLRTHCRLLDFNLKNSTGRSPILILAPFRSSADRVAHLPLKTAHGARHFCVFVFGGSVNDRIAFRTLKVHYLPPPTRPYFQSRLSLQNIVVCKQEMPDKFLVCFFAFFL